jgi:hypothetical protein
MMSLMMKAASTSETPVNFTRLHDATSQKTAIFILDAVRTSNLTKATLVDFGILGCDAV